MKFKLSRGQHGERLLEIGNYIWCVTSIHTDWEDRLDDYPPSYRIVRCVMFRLTITLEWRLK